MEYFILQNYMVSELHFFFLFDPLWTDSFFQIFTNDSAASLFFSNLHNRLFFPNHHSRHTTAASFPSHSTQLLSAFYCRTSWSSFFGCWLLPTPLMEKLQITFGTPAPSTFANLPAASLTQFDSHSSLQITVLHLNRQITWNGFSPLNSLLMDVEN